MAEIHFIGGIHGVGKGEICKSICKESNLSHLLASKLIKWTDFNSNGNKEVVDIKDTQGKLLLGLKNTVSSNKRYLLDGHLCLLNAKSEIERVPLVTFKSISPKTITVVTADIEIIKQRLEKRDSKIYELSTLRKLQESELQYGEQVARCLNVPFLNVRDGDVQNLMDLIL